MTTYRVSFLKYGELFETVVKANNKGDARKFVANKENIPFNFEISGEYYNSYLENNHVSSVLEL